MKKGELTINYIIIIILALLVLIVVAIIFRNQIGDFVQNIRGLSSGFNADIQQSAQGLAP